MKLAYEPGFQGSLIIDQQIQQIPSLSLGETRLRRGGTILGMPNIAALLKSEISRVARKEVRAETSALKKAASAYRADIAALKRRAHALEQQLRGLNNPSAKLAPAAEREVSSDTRRFSAKGLASQRRRLGLSAADFGLLVGASSQSIYNWEDGNVRPQARHLLAIAALRTLGKKEAALRLESLREAG